MLVEVRSDTRRRRRREGENFGHELS